MDDNHETDHRHERAGHAVNESLGKAGVLEDGDIFAQIGGVNDGFEGHVGYDDEAQEKLVVEPDSPHVLQDSLPNQAEQRHMDKDLSDLLAEFEGANEPLHGDESSTEAIPPAQQLPHTPEHADPKPLLNGEARRSGFDLHEEQPQERGEQIPITNGQSPFSAPNSLIADGFNEPSPFDDLLAQSESVSAVESVDNTPAESPVPNLSIEHSQHDLRLLGITDDAVGDTSVQSLFSNASDWLADTTIDESFQVGDNGGGRAELVADGQAEMNAGSKPVPIELPQGWYDDQGEWKWYTEEEKEQVRLTMLDEAGVADGSPVGVRQDQPIHGYSSPIAFSPTIYPGMSENQARRTPRPEQTSVFPEMLPQDPYSLRPSIPPDIGSHGISSGPSAAYNDGPSSYAPSAPAHTPSYAGQMSYDPYAPTPQPFAAQYAPSRSVSGFGPSVAGPSNPPLGVKPKPAVPKRMVSNAYDPPFLKPQKSFIRSTSAIPAVVPAFAAPSQSAKMAPPPAPPPGPPRRTGTTHRPPSRGPSYDAAPSYASNQAGSSTANRPDTGLGIVHGVSMSGSQTEYTPLSDGNQYDSQAEPVRHPMRSTSSMVASRAPPPRTASYSAFDPPLRPATTSGRSSFISPPARTVTPPSLASSRPPLEQGYTPVETAMIPPSRKVSPMFEARPPSRTSVQSRSDRIPSPFDPSPYRQTSSRGLESDKITNSKIYEAQRIDPQSQSPQFPSGDLGDYDERQEQHRAYDRDEHESPFAQSGHSPDDGLNSRQYDEPRYNRNAGPNYRSASPSLTGLGLHQMSPPIQHLPLQLSYDIDSYGNGYKHEDHMSYEDSTPRSDYPQYSRQQPTSSYEPSSYVPPSQSTAFNGARDPYGPPEPGSYGHDYEPSPPQTDYFHSSSMQDETYVPQQVLEQRPISEDPLGRCTDEARNIPLAVFGFGGILITAFPAMADDGTALAHARSPSYGYASGRGQLWLRKITDIITDNALESNESGFPGPLVLDPAAPKGSAADKKKREAVMAYLEARGLEIEKGLPYLKSSASRARGEEEGKLVLVRLLTAMIIGEGKLSGSNGVEDAVRAALANPSSASTNVLPPTKTPVSPIHTYSSVYPPAASRTAAPAAASPAQLAHLSRMLVSGDKREAAQYAAGAGLWSHALIISSSIDQHLWREIVSRFASAELGAVVLGTAAMKASYALFSGSTLTIVDDLMTAANVTGDASSDSWRDVLSAVVFNGKASDFACLDDLGQRLMSAGLANAAYAYSLFSASSPFADVTSAAYDRPILLTQSPKDDNAAVFAEIAEYARSLSPVPKGQEAPFPSLPQLLPHKLHRAWRAAELGEIDQAQRYCAAVEAASKPSKNGPPLMSRALLASLEDLLERLTGTPSANPTSIIGPRKAVKPGFDKLGSWIEGRLTKFIAGEEDGNTASPKAIAAPPTKGNPQAPVGPFSHFSTISPGASGQVSRTPSTADFTATNGHLGIQPDSRRTSPNIPSQAFFRGDHARQGSSSSSSYGDPYAPQAIAHTWGMSQDVAPNDEDERDDDTPQRESDLNGDREGLLNPMETLSLGGGTKRPSNASYEPRQQLSTNDDDDLGFGNASLSRARTPRPAEEGGTSQDVAKANAKVEETKKTKPEAARSDSPGKAEQKASWLGRWWGKKEGESSGPIKAKLGNESSMVFDPELKRWVVKGAKGDAAPPAPPAPPPRSQTVSPSRATHPESSSVRATTESPPPSQVARNSMPPPALPSVTGLRPPTTGPNGGIRRMKSSVAESVIPADAPGAGMLSGPPPSVSRAATPASLDDLLSRPPSKRPASVAARKGARNRYVDVFQPTQGAEGT